MRILFHMAPAILHGSSKEKCAALFALAAWFCMGGFVSSALFYYLDPYVAADLSGGLPSAIAGTITAAVAAAKGA